MGDIRQEIAKKEVELQEVKEQIFKVAPQFKAWIEGTNLFNAIKTDASRVSESVSATVRVHEPDGSHWELNLNGIVIQKAEDLPIELIENFYRHWSGTPEYKSVKETKLIQDGTSEDQSSNTIIIS